MSRVRNVFAFCLIVVSPLANAGDDPHLVASAAPMEIPHLAKLDLDARANRKKSSGILESHVFLDLTPGLKPMPFPKNTDLRARILTPELRRTPVVGWIAANLYRDKKDNGWCLEVDPGEGEYVVFYRVHLN